MVVATEQPQELTGLDQALQALRLDMTDPKRQSKYYDLFLNTTFCVPALDPQELAGAAAGDLDDIATTGQLHQSSESQHGASFSKAFSRPASLRGRLVTRPPSNVP